MKMVILALHPVLKRKASPHWLHDDFAPTPTTLALDHQITNTEKEFRLEIDVPGVKSSDLSLSVKDDTILISGVRRRATAVDGSSANKKHRFEKSFHVNTKIINLNEVKANLADGVLVVTAPKRPKSQPKTIVITTTDPLQDLNQTESKSNATKVNDTDDRTGNGGEAQESADKDVAGDIKETKSQ